MAVATSPAFLGAFRALPRTTTEHRNDVMCLHVLRCSIPKRRTALRPTPASYPLAPATSSRGGLSPGPRRAPLAGAPRRGAAWLAVPGTAADPTATWTARGAKMKHTVLVLRTFSFKPTVQLGEARCSFRPVPCEATQHRAASHRTVPYYHAVYLVATVRALYQQTTQASSACMNAVPRLPGFPRCPEASSCVPVGPPAARGNLQGSPSQHLASLTPSTPSRMLDQF